MRHYKANITLDSIEVAAVDNKGYIHLFTSCVPL